MTNKIFTYNKQHYIRHWAVNGSCIEPVRCSLRNKEGYCTASKDFSIHVPCTQGKNMFILELVLKRQK